MAYPICRKITFPIPVTDRNDLRRISSDLAGNKKFPAIYFHAYFIHKLQIICKMIPGSKVHAFHACMKKHEFETRTNMRTKPVRAEFECL
jgi:hypothetical protein